MPDDSVEDAGPSDPLSGLAFATKDLFMNVGAGLADYPVVVSRIISSKEENRAGITAEFALDSTQGVSGIVGTAVRAPMDFTLGLASGFHNLPKSFGDDTVRVRHVERITGFQSGLKAAGKVNQVPSQVVISRSPTNEITELRIRTLRWDHRTCFAPHERRHRKRPSGMPERIRTGTWRCSM
jgi:hypothetical protein